MSVSLKKRRAPFGALLWTGAALCAVAGVGLLAASGSASRSAAPVNTSPPTITGQAQQGQTLGGHKGAWTSSKPVTYMYQWKRCDASGANCALPPNNNDDTYVMSAPDVGRTIRLTVKASNADGEASATSAATAVVTAAAAKPPSNTSPPSISGTPQVGQTLTADFGNWTGKAPITYAYQWQRCNTSGASCSSIIGATKKTYLLTGVDAGNTLRVAIVATDANGSTPATSAPTAVVTSGTKPPPPPPPATSTGCPTGTGAVQVANVASPARLLIDQQQSDPAVIRRSSKQVIIRYHVTACGGRAVEGALVYATAVPFNQLSIPPERATNSDGWAQLEFRMLAGFPISSRQQLVALFVRARKAGENPLGGISTRRLFSIRVSG